MAQFKLPNLHKLNPIPPKWLVRHGHRFSVPQLLVVAVVMAGVGVYALLQSSALEATGSISGYAFKDMNRNGMKDEGEEVWSEGHQLYFFAPDGNYHGTLKTDASGFYSLTGLTPGTYRVLYSHPSWGSVRIDWAPTTTKGNLRAEQFIEVSGDSNGDFGWRPIVRSTDRNAPISQFVAPNGLTLRSYNDVVTAEQMYETMQRGSLMGKETPHVYVNLGFGFNSSTTSSVTSNAGVYTNYKASSWIAWDRWLDDLNNEQFTLWHEYGHAWSLYHGYITQQDPLFTEYLRIRGLHGDARLNTSYAWSVSEMIAEDYRQLFGANPDIQGSSQTNYSIPKAASIPGLKEYLSGKFLEPTVISDTLAPGVPSSLQATTNTSEEGASISLSWVASTDNVGVVKYEILRDGAVVGFTNGATTYYDGGLQPGTRYGYGVRAVDAAGNTSALSPTIYATTPLPDATPPTPPTSLRTTSVTGNTIVLAWSPSTDNVGVKEYRVYQKQTIGKGKTAQTVWNQIATTTGTTYTHSVLKANTTYEYYVVARDGAGNQSTQSNTLTVKTARR